MEFWAISIEILSPIIMVIKVLSSGKFFKQVVIKCTINKHSEVKLFFTK